MQQSYTESGHADSHGGESTGGRQAKLSYKFQRLRERLRQAVTNGELTGKLPGERQLARKFRVNAKTLSKALTDLAAEGLLDRSIGRGTFVRGATETVSANTDRWLIVADADRADSRLVRSLLEANPGSQVITETTSLRPSFMNQFKGIVNLSSATPESFLRDLVVRNMTVVLVDREPETYSMHSVVFDRTLAASRLARQLIVAGHTRFLAVEAQGQRLLADAIRTTAARLNAEVTVDPAYPREIPTSLQGGATAILCDSAITASTVKQILHDCGISSPGRVSLVAIDSGEAQLPCSGYCLEPSQQAQSVIQILRDQKSRRPMTLWLAGTFQNLGTMGAPSQEPADCAPPMTSNQLSA